MVTSNPVAAPGPLHGGPSRCMAAYLRCRPQSHPSPFLSRRTLPLTNQIKALLGFGQPDDAAWISLYTTSKENAAVRQNIVSVRFTCSLGGGVAALSFAMCKPSLAWEDTSPHMNWSRGAALALLSCTATCCHATTASAPPPRPLTQHHHRHRHHTETHTCTRTHTAMQCHRLH